MKRLQVTIITIILTASSFAQDMLVRISEIEVYPQYLKEYLAFANEVDRLSMEREPGVVCLFPMQSAEDSTQIRILEIYASQEAYQSHIQSAGSVPESYPVGPFPEVQAGHAPHGEEPELARYDSTRPRNDETDIHKTKINENNYYARGSIHDVAANERTEYGTYN